MKLLQIDIKKNKAQKHIKKQIRIDILNVDIFKTRTKVNTRNGRQSMK